MTTFLYSVNEIGREAGFSSPATWTRMKTVMPAPDGVMVSKILGAGWTLDTWETAVEKQPASRQGPMRKAIARLRERELEIQRTYADQGDES